MALLKLKAAIKEGRPHMKLNLKSTIAAPAGNNSCQKALNGIIGNTRRGIVVDKTLDPDSNNPVSNKPVSTALAALAGKIDAALQKPTGLTKTKLVGVGTNGQENIEIGENLTLANGKLAAGGSVSPTLNLIDFKNGGVRTTITEEEEQNIEKGLYNSVLYYDDSLGEAAEYSIYFPENAICNDGALLFSIYKLVVAEDGESSIASIRVYSLNIEAKNPNGTYPITIESMMEAPFGSDSIGSSNDISHRLNLMNEDLSAVRTSITEEEKHNISKGLYHSVLYIDSSLGEAASMSYRLPENAFHSNVNGRFGFSIYKVDSNYSITGARIYELRIGEQGSDGTYPITVSKITDLPFGGDNLLQKPSGLTKTELVGVGSNGQENIEIGDNLTLANGKLSATGGGGGSSDINYINASFTDEENFIGTFTGSINPDAVNIIKANLYDGHMPMEIVISSIQKLYGQTIQQIGYSCTGFLLVDGILEEIAVIQDPINGSKTINGQRHNIKNTYYHFISMIDSASNVSLYLTIQNTSKYTFSDDGLASYLSGKKVLANGNLHGVVPTYIAGEGGVIKIYYRTPGDSNINPTPDEYQDLSSFTITDLVSPVE